MNWARLVLTVVLVVGSGSVSAAECAWVLWLQVDSQNMIIGQGTSNNREWELFEAYKEKNICDVAMQNTWNQKVKQWEGNPLVTNLHKSSGWLSIAIQSEKQLLTHEYTYRCLPDTIDPREKE